MARKNNFNPRFNHVGKSSYEKRNYREWINTPQKKIETTLSDYDIDNNIETAKTDYEKGDIVEKQTIDKTEKKPKKNKKQKPYFSFKTKVKKGLNYIIWVVIVSGVLGVCVTTVWSQQRELGKISSDVESFRKDLDYVQNKYNNSTENKINDIKLLTQIQSDLGYLKERVIKLENRLNF